MLQFISMHADKIAVQRNVGGGIEIILYHEDQRISVAANGTTDQAKTMINALIEAGKHPERVNAISSLAALTCEDCGCGHVETGGVRPEDGQ